MGIDERTPDVSASELGQEMYQLVTELYPICRSITGDGVRRTLELVGRHVPLETFEVPSGTQVFDWTVPKEWNIDDAWVKDQRGERVIDFGGSNLHVVSYSTPVRKTVSLAELNEHLFTLPEHPQWIPYRTSYYREAWGFCMSEDRRSRLADEDYEVCIDASLEEGHLTYAECFLPGRSEEEFLVSCHVCHPSLANDNLSGIAVASSLARHLSRLDLRYSYRFIFIPGTIGSITWLAHNEAAAARIAHGLVVAGVGDAGPFTYKRSRQGSAEIDRAMCHVLERSGRPFQVVDFSPYGYDERQFCSPGFDLPVGRFSRSPHGEYPEYHTSADDLDLVRPEHLAESFLQLLAAVELIEHDRTYTNTNPKCEPQLGRRGLYKAVGGQADQEVMQLALLWVLNQSDGSRSLLDITQRSGLAFEAVRRAADALAEHSLLEETSPASQR
ncbi:MAG TPA: DUF4910 domain-containing protein [Acidimicrobiales bacterium]|nr:DUF4910 domain-containing protein [Acidimicrobiales bacterium]